MGGIGPQARVQTAAPTKAQQDARRANGKHGGHPRAPQFSNAQRANRLMARRLLMNEQLETARFLIHCRDNPRLPIDIRVRAAESILNRGGTPPVAHTEHSGEIAGDAAQVKLVVLRQFAQSGNDGAAKSDAGTVPGESERPDGNGPVLH